MEGPGQLDTPRPAKKKKRNQHKPIRELHRPLPFMFTLRLVHELAAEEDLWPIIKYYWSLGFNDKDIAHHAIDHFDQSEYGLR